MFSSPFADHILHDRTAVNINVNLSKHCSKKKTPKVRCNIVNIISWGSSTNLSHSVKSPSTNVGTVISGLICKYQQNFSAAIWVIIHCIKKCDMNNFMLCVYTKIKMFKFKILGTCLQKLLRHFPAILMLYLYYIFLLHHYCSVHLYENGIYIWCGFIILQNASNL